MDLNTEKLPNFKSSFLLFKRKWKRLPKFLRFYLIVAIIFIIFTFSYYVLFIATKKSLIRIDENVDPLLNNDNNGDSNQNIHPPSQFIEHNIMLPPQNSNSDNFDNTNKEFVSTKKLPSILLDGDDNDDDGDKMITNEELFIASKKQNEQQKLIQEAIQHSWNGYRKYAWGKDMLKPITQKGSNWFGIGLTILDSLDTLLIAGLNDEFKQGLEWVKNDLTFDVNENVNCFETTIRALAGLMSAYHISKEKILLEKAIDLGDRLIHCFDSQSKTVPFSDVNLKKKMAKAPSYMPESSLSEVSSVQLEFRDLSYETNDKSYEEKSFATSKHIHDLIQQRKNYLLPMYINPYTGNLMTSTITMGARADSYYEYLYKQYLQTKIEFLLDDYIRSIDAIENRLTSRTKSKLKLLYIGEILNTDQQSIHPKMDHLVCFLSGTLALGYYHEHLQPFYRLQIVNETFINHLKLAEDLARTCHYMYNLTETGLSPEIGYFGQDYQDGDFYIKPRDTHNLLRPEFVESLFFLYHITGKQIYRDWGLQVFNAFQKYTRINTGGYTTINDVRHPKNVKPKDKMESFWLAETLKYLYLLFMDDHKIIRKLLNNYVFNTEGHLLPRRV
ncbi:Endoplasmic reticulum mannosyl-oligosaccharide 1,2-alpha-mannosidase [Dermatophagoides pteronyssinus]|uniref:alpha-1,2-Mannosidase n=1 Tax=Dermatophagoides pteronyssinus TaxID=6956 RepID=A0ABQ8J239_DERPT|nr:Endoplasmic reticulum mannosyl-oligosaccharide 1,2-alpha-mannosidase [Dermatophagoides pteronyssinus]